MQKSFQEIYELAAYHGMMAGEAVTPTPISVTPVNFANEPVGPSWHVPEGLCGFAWVTFKGNTGFGRWAKKEGLARKQYGGGLAISVSEFNQSVARKEAYAYAFAKTLREHGITAYADSRLD